MKWSVLINPFVGCVTHSPLSEHRRGIECVCALYSDLWAAPNVQSQHVILPDGSGLGEIQPLIDLGRGRQCSSCYCATRAPPTPGNRITVSKRFSEFS
ncbi:hypothetical protein Y032_0012g1817 [Ancylostoma ceylanicum]|uniref:Uncharacterized protein n=1 Tax=Ancylostoma ceylanicum TaxID=53326 RepID=A0A016VDG0_9BILA|nr:hypothetical protein Y032_0012g1817 [Ancylostoma ceylanicum]